MHQLGGKDKCGWDWIKSGRLFSWGDVYSDDDDADDNDFDDDNVYIDEDDSDGDDDIGE